MNKVFLYILALPLCSCSILKTEKLNKEETANLHQTEIKSKNGLQASKYQSLIFLDSSDQKYCVAIKPLGTFTFNGKDGFKGRADAIFLNGTIGTKSKVTKNKTVALQQTNTVGFKNLLSQKDTKTVKIVSNKKTVPTLLLVAGCALVLATGLYITKNHLNKRR